MSISYGKGRTQPPRTPRTPREANIGRQSGSPALCSLQALRVIQSAGWPPRTPRTPRETNTSEQASSLALRSRRALRVIQPAGWPPRTPRTPREINASRPASSLALRSRRALRVIQPTREETPMSSIPPLTLRGNGGRLPADWLSAGSACDSIGRLASAYPANSA